MAPSPDRDIRLLFPLPLATIASQSSMASIPPLFIGISQDFDATIGTVGQVRAISALTAVLATLLVGGWIHKRGARPVMLIGGVLGALGALLSAHRSGPCGLRRRAGGHRHRHLLPALERLRRRRRVLRARGARLGDRLGRRAAVAGLDRRRADRRVARGSVRLALWLRGPGLLLPGRGRRSDPLRTQARPDTFAPPTSAPGCSLPWPIAAAGDGRSAELLAFAVWTAEITYIAAFYSEEFSLTEAVVGFLLPLGSLAFMVGSATAARAGREVAPPTAADRLDTAMGAIAATLFNFHPFLMVTLVLAIAMGIAAGLRAAGSSTLALDQLPDKPGAMMAARTGAVQIGYLIGASIGGVIVDSSGFGGLGLFMIVGMASSAMVMAGVPARAEPEPSTAR